MEPSEAGASRPVVAPADRLEELSASARGWHTTQMAVLGSIGICGVLRTTDSPARCAVQWLAAALAVAALAAASLAIFTVGRVADRPARRSSRRHRYRRPLAISGGS